MNNEEKQLIIDSIDHWQKDAVEIFDRGFDFHRENNQWFNRDGNFLWSKLKSDYCSLCIHFDMDCYYCLWYKYSLDKCFGDKQEFTKFRNDPTRENALKVIEKLWKIGTNV